MCMHINLCKCVSGMSKKWHAVLYATSLRALCIERPGKQGYGSRSDNSYTTIEYYYSMNVYSFFFGFSWNQSRQWWVREFQSDYLFSLTWDKPGLNDYLQKSNYLPEVCIASKRCTHTLCECV